MYCEAHFKLRWFLESQKFNNIFSFIFHIFGLFNGFPLYLKSLWWQWDVLLRAQGHLIGAKRHYLILSFTVVWVHYEPMCDFLTTLVTNPYCANTIPLQDSPICTPPFYIAVTFYITMLTSTSSLPTPPTPLSLSPHSPGLPPPAPPPPPPLPIFVWYWW